MSQRNSGLFIMIDGIDGSGKGLQTDLLHQRLSVEGCAVKKISFPRYGQKSAAPIEEYLAGIYGTAEEVGPYRGSILYAVDRFAAARDINSWLAEGSVVIANRYVSSNMGHQGGKIADPAERQKFFTWNYDLEYRIFAIPKPDIQLILHVDPVVAQELVDKKSAADRAYVGGVKRDIHEADINHLRNAEQTYLEMVRLFPDFQLIECMENGQIMPPEKIQELIWNTVAPRLQKKNV
jgi:dTMP kinase